MALIILKWAGSGGEGIVHSWGAILGQTLSATLHPVHFCRMCLPCSLAHQHRSVQLNQQYRLRVRKQKSCALASVRPSFIVYFFLLFMALPASVYRGVFNTSFSKPSWYTFTLLKTATAHSNHRHNRHSQTPPHYNLHSLVVHWSTGTGHWSPFSANSQTLQVGRPSGTVTSLFSKQNLSKNI